VALALPAHIRLGFKDPPWTRSLFRTFVSYDRKKCNNIGPRTRLGLLKWHHDIQHYNKKETLSITPLNTVILSAARLNVFITLGVIMPSVVRPSVVAPFQLEERN
jgi:hypothetical protein